MKNYQLNDDLKLCTKCYLKMVETTKAISGVINPSTKESISSKGYLPMS